MLVLISVATFTDLRSRRIPNWLNLPFLVAGIVVSTVLYGWHGLKRIEIDRARLSTIEGTVPNLAALPPGCSFAPRCGARIPQCTHAFPGETLVGPAHAVRCYLHGPGAAASTPDSRVPTAEGARP